MLLRKIDNINLSGKRGCYLLLNNLLRINYVEKNHIICILTLLKFTK